MRPLGVHLSLKSWTLWSTREGGETHGVFISYPHPLNIPSCSSPAHPVVTRWESPEVSRYDIITILKPRYDIIAIFNILRYGEYCDTIYCDILRYNAVHYLFSAAKYTPRKTSSTHMFYIEKQS